ncbi:MAG: integrase [Cycloclasticus pugetii]|jgi:integrase|uniref:tyrosine-type recombinase/integrase n=1 Tax=Cycloclasticus pugetii TaxID=34068 RepID=UPI0039E523B7
MKKIKELTPIQIKKLNDNGRYPVGGVSGLYIQVTSSSGKSWLLRIMVGEKRRDIGLGSYPSISLADARTKAREVRALVKSGVDPIRLAKEKKQAQIIAQRQYKTFSEVAQQCYDAKKSEFKNKKHSQQWISTLQAYAYSVIGDMGIEDIGINDVLSVLKPIWETKTETATRVRQRMASVFDYAITMEIRAKANPAQWKGRLENLLAKPQSIVKNQGKADNHHPALPVDQMHTFFVALLQENYMSARALAFSILTGARSGEVRFMTWDELDINKSIWTIRGTRMKGGKAHQVSLSPCALSIINMIDRDMRSAYVFRNSQRNPLSDAIFKKVIVKIHHANIKKDPTSTGFIDPHQDHRIVTPHGFRSTLKDWARTQTSHSDEVSELALAHINSDATRAAYARDQLLDERYQLLNEWGAFCLNGNATHLRLVK